MHKDEPQRIGWTPSSEEEQAAVRSQLEEMLRSPLFCNSKRYPSLLRYLVEQTLAGNEGLLKERLLGISVFHRSPDYDTNQDTVVRLTAGEVRKRIAQYYHLPENADQLRIDLVPGSYIPLFRRSEPQSSLSPGAPPEIRLEGATSGLAVISTETESSPQERDWDSSVELQPSTSAQRKPHPLILMEKGKAKQTELRQWTYWLGAAFLLLVVIAGALAWHAHQAVHTANQQLWAPILQEPGPVQLVIADLSASVGYAQEHQLKQATGLFDLLRMGELVNYRDSLAQSGIVALLAQHNKPYALELSTRASYPDLQRSASVLIGGLDNVWTMRVTDPLRFHFVRRASPYIFSIVDRQHPELGGWNADLAQPAERSTEDYAIIARIFDQTTGRPVLVAAGLGANGTTAAAQFLLDPARTAELAAHAPREWQRLNMEAVLKTQILDNHAGPPHLVTCIFW